MNKNNSIMRILLHLLLFTTGFLTMSAKETVTVVIHSKSLGYVGFEAFADQAAFKLQEILNSDQFHEEVLLAHFTETNGKTNQQIYDAIMLAHELSGDGGSDHVVDLRVRTITKEDDGKRWMRYCKPGSVMGTIGKDGGDSGITAICSKWLQIWFDNKDYASLASHYAHEYMHIIGFMHNHAKATSVPYVIDGIVEKLIRKKI